MISQLPRANSLPLFPANSPSSSGPLTPLSFTNKRHSERAVSPASSAGSHASGVSHPPGSRKRRRTTIVTDVSSDELLSSIDKWDDGFSPLESLSSTSRLRLPSPGSSWNPFLPDPTRRKSDDTPDRSPKDVRRKMSIPNLLNVAKLPSISAVCKPSALYICDCCPRNPKKFDNKNDLHAHELEKLVSCPYCGRRFQKDAIIRCAHLWSYSWSCSAIPSFQAAFHASQPSPHKSNTDPEYDWCGYCGKEFPNFPQPHWDLRFEHLTKVHKFGECISSKRFFIEDHFRQHIKHTHAGATGAWSAFLVKACLREESSRLPPDQNHVSSAVAMGGARAISDIKLISQGSGVATSLNPLETEPYPSLSFLRAGESG